MIVPFMRFGEFVLQAPRLDVVPQHFSDLFRAGAALKGLGHAVLGWLLLSVLLVWPVATLLTPCFAVLKERYISLHKLFHFLV